MVQRSRGSQGRTLSRAVLLLSMISIALRLEVIASRVEAIAIRLEAIAGWRRPSLVRSFAFNDLYDSSSICGAVKGLPETGR